MKKGYLNFITFFLSVSFGASIGYAIIKNSITSSVMQNNIKHTVKNNNYSANFDINKKVNTSVDTYLQKKTDIQSAEYDYYNKMFLLDAKKSEDDFNKYFENDYGKIEIPKNSNVINYYPNKDMYTRKDLINEEESKTIALDFLEKNNIFFDYDEISIKETNTNFDLTFINRIGNLKNYCFPNTLLLDKFGNIISFKYYFIEYKKFENTNIKNLRDAYYEIPMNYQNYTNSKISINDYELVYIYDESIIQPAYKFFAKDNNGELFEYFIKASIY